MASALYGELGPRFERLGRRFVKLSSPFGMCNTSGTHFPWQAQTSALSDERIAVDACLNFTPNIAHTTKHGH